MQKITLFEFTGSDGTVIAEVPILVYDGEAMHNMLEHLLPDMLPSLQSVVVRSLLTAADTARQAGAHKLDEQIPGYVGFALDYGVREAPEEPGEIFPRGMWN